MNAITIAMKEAGVKLPTIAERVWRVIKDEPGLTSTQLHKRLPAIALGSVTSQLHVMEQRGMIYAKGTKGRGPSGKAKAYYTDMDAYKRLPPPKTNGKTPAAQPTTHTPAPADPRDTLDAFVDSLTIAQARTLYAKLKRMFA